MEDLNLRIQVAVCIYGYKQLDNMQYQEPEENNEGYGLSDYEERDLPEWETDIKLAWGIVEKMAKALDGQRWTGFDLAELLDMPSEEAATAICKSAVATIDGPF